MIAMLMALALQVLDPAGQAQYEQDIRDAQMDQRMLEETLGTPQEGAARDAEVPQDPRPEPSEPPSKSQVKELGRRIGRMGDAYEAMGRCAGSMTPGEVEATLRQAQAHPAAEYLLGRYERGFRKPKGDDWCAKELGRL